MSAPAPLAQCRVAALWRATPTVLRVSLQLLAPQHEFSFQPGQWVDCHTPAAPGAVGGYSICSSCSQLARFGTFELAVKASGHPVATWLHRQATVGDTVAVRVGGSFTLSPGSSQAPCLFVAGGIGITALAAMLLELAEQQQQQHHVPRLLFSAASPEEFALLDKLLPLHQAGRLHLQLHTTRRHGGLPAGSSEGQPQPAVLQGRIDKQALARALARPAEATLAYVCGPPGMTDGVLQWLVELGCKRERVFAERWW